MKDNETKGKIKFCDNVYVLVLILSVLTMYPDFNYQLEYSIEPLDNVLLSCSEIKVKIFCSVHFSSVALSCRSLCDPMNCSTQGLLVHHQLPESTQTHVNRVSDAIQQSRPLSSPSPPALNLSQHQDLCQWVSSSHQVAKVLEFQLQH